MLRNKLLLLFVLCMASTGWAGVPDWLRSVAHESLPKYKDDTNGVVLLHEELTSVDASGEIRTTYREAIKILRPVAREDLSRVAVHFDNETKLTWLKGWSITATGQEYEVKEKDAVETNAVSDNFMSDSRLKLLHIPGADVGTVVGYEYQQRWRPSIYEDIWGFQRSLPVHTSRYTLHLPPGWEYEVFWNNHPSIDPTVSGPDITWQATDVPALEEEDYMPPWRAIAGRMLLHILSPNGQKASGANWERVGTWYSGLFSDRRDSSPELKKQVQDLTANSKTTLEKMEVLSHWVQKEIRYVAIEIGIGGFQPHRASDIYRNRYGDCKDKVTLLGAMLKEIGVDSDYVLIHTSRGVVKPDSPSAVTFNHVIAGILLPKDLPTTSLYALYRDPKLGTMLLFDPTDELTPFGYLPSTLQETKALLVAGNSGEIIDTPLLAPARNVLQRSGKLKLAADGSLSGQIEEARQGVVGRDFRERLLGQEMKDRAKSIESVLSGTIAAFELTKAEVGNLDQVAQPLLVRYTFVAPSYAKKAGGLLLVRPRVLGQKNWSIMEGNKRIYPVEYDSASYQSDTFEIELPPAFDVDEMPDPVDVVYDFGEYHSKVEHTGNELKYTRQFIIKKVMVPTDRLDDLKKFYRQIANDERNTAVLKAKAEAGK